MDYRPAKAHHRSKTCLHCEIEVPVRVLLMDDDLPDLIDSLELMHHFASFSVGVKLNNSESYEGAG